MVTYQNRVYLFGGIDSTGNYLNDMYTLMIEGDKALWTLVVAGEDSDPVPEPRAFHSMDVVDGMICIFGGYSFTKVRLYMTFVIAPDPNKTVSDILVCSVTRAWSTSTQKVVNGRAKMNLMHPCMRLRSL
jgi:hypothetical protein